jgi:hypothetical protein
MAVVLVGCLSFFFFFFFFFPRPRKPNISLMRTLVFDAMNYLTVFFVAGVGPCGLRGVWDERDLEALERKVRNLLRACAARDFNPIFVFDEAERGHERRWEKRARIGRATRGSMTMAYGTPDLVMAALADAGARMVLHGSINADDVVAMMLFEDEEAMAATKDRDIFRYDCEIDGETHTIGVSRVMREISVEAGELIIDQDEIAACAKDRIRLQRPPVGFTADLCERGAHGRVIKDDGGDGGGDKASDTSGDGDGADDENSAHQARQGAATRTSSCTDPFAIVCGQGLNEVRRPLIEALLHLRGVGGKVVTEAVWRDGAVAFETTTLRPSERYAENLRSPDESSAREAARWALGFLREADSRADKVLFGDALRVRDRARAAIAADCAFKAFKVEVEDPACYGRVLLDLNHELLPSRCGGRGGTLVCRRHRHRADRGRRGPASVRHPGEPAGPPPRRHRRPRRCRLCERGAGAPRGPGQVRHHPQCLWAD